MNNYKQAFQKYLRVTLILFLCIGAVKSAAAQDLEISGSSSVNCASTYSYSLLNASVSTGWTWVADGGTILTGQGSTSVNVRWDQDASNNGPELSVSLNNSVIDAAHLTITPTQLSAPTISNEVICPGATATLDIGQEANWYDSDPSLSSVSPTIVTYYNVSPSVTTDYWVSLGAGECESAATKVTVSVSSLDEGSLTTVPEIYPGQIPAQINGTAGTYSNGSVSYQWQKSTTSASANFSDVNGATNQNYQPPATDYDTWYRRKLVTNCGGSYYTNVIKVEVDETAPSMNGTAAVNCADSYTYSLQNPTVTTGWTWVADGGTILSGQGTTSVSVRWDQDASNNGPQLSVSLDNSILGAIHKPITPTQLSAPTISNEVICPGASVTLNVGQEANWYDSDPSASSVTPTVTTNYNVSPGTTTTYYVSLGVGECESTATAVTVTVASLNEGTLTAPEPIYAGEVPGQINGTAGTYSNGSVAYAWEYSTTSQSAGFSTLAGQSGQNYQPGAISVDTWYRRKLETDCGDGYYTNVIKVDVDETVPVMNGSASVDCYSTYTYSLQNPTITTGWTWVAQGGSIVSGQGSSSVDVIWDGGDGSSYQLSTSLNNGVMGAIHKTITMSVSPQGGTAQGAQSDLCYGSNPTPLTVTGGTETQASFQWQVRSLNSPGSFWTDIDGATSSSYDPNVIYEGLEFRRKTSHCWSEVYSTAVSVTVKSEDFPGAITGEQTIYENEKPLVLSNDETPQASETYTIKWQKSTTGPDSGFTDVLDGNSNQITELYYQPPVDLTADVWYRRIMTTSCGSSQTESVKITVIDLPDPGTITGGGTVCSDVRPSTVTGTNPMLEGALFQWEYSYDQVSWTPVSDQEGLNYHPGYLKRNTYLRRVMYLDGLKLASNVVSFTANDCNTTGKPQDLTTVTTVTEATAPSSASVNELNFVRSYDVLIKGIEDYSNVTSNTDNAEVIMSTQYMDGLGRPIQTVSRGASPAEKDMVSINGFDEFGREARTFLPYESNSDNGKFNTDAGTQQGTFNTSQYPGDSHFYSEVLIENSPVNRPLLQIAPGKNWQGNGNGVAIHYDVNTAAEGIRYWTIGSAESSLPVSNSTYSTGELSVAKTLDENGNSVVEYTDKEGRVILKKVEGEGAVLNSHTGWLATYYVYDDFNQLRAVIPPLAVEKLSTSSWTVSNNLADDLLFRYNYDGRNRMITKQVPGAGEVRMVYDKLDRLVLTQDANQSAIDQWTFTKYDVLSRPVLTGFVTTTANRAGLQAIADAWSGDMHVLKEALETEGVEEVLNGYTLSVSHRNPNITKYRTKHAQGEGFIEFLPGFDSEAGAEFDTELTTSASYEYTGIQGYHDATFPLLKDYENAYELLTLNYYDDYDFTAKTWSSDFSGFYTTAQQQADYHFITPEQFDNVKGKATGSKVKILGSESFLTTVMYYDDRGRVVQSQSDNHLGGTDITTTQYDFAGRVLHTYTKHSNPLAGNTSILKQFTYDHAGRLRTVKEKLNDTGDLKTLVTNTYNKLGELERKELGDELDPLETLDYDYNVRGWLNSINGDELETADHGTQMTNHYFAMGLSYDNGFTGRQYNGNISGVKWKTKSSDQIKAYGFKYDPVNRLKVADYSQGSTWANTVSDFSTSYGYDANGNILNLMRKSTIAGTITTIDDLAYDYGAGYNTAGTANQLQRVKDDAGDLEQGDFKDGNSSGNDYEYDANGNMKDDMNKGITNITYNHLNLPTKVSFGSTKSIEYTYDAAGIKLQKLTDDNGSITTTDYIGGFIYENNALQHLAHEEGRVRIEGGTNKYDYFIKDHLGNTRMTLTEARDSTVYDATMETALSSFENDVFLNIDATRSNDEAFEGTQSALVGPESIGPAKMLMVSPGDTVDLSIYAKYPGTFNSTEAGESTNVGLALASLFGATGSGASVYEQGTYTALNNNAGTFLASTAQTGSSTVPLAYLNYIFFDQDFNLVTGASGYQQIDSGAEDIFDLIEANGLIMSEAGYLYVYVSNEGRTLDGGNVYFDALRINHKKGAILQEDHYYPFGLSINALSSSAPLSKPNRFKYNGKELQTEFDINWYNYGARMYDAALGRWNHIDKLAEDYEAVSPYVYALNDPTNAIDPDGNLVIFANGFMLNHWEAGQEPERIVNGDTWARNPKYTGYVPDRGFYKDGPRNNGTTFSYWGKIDDAIMQGHDDYNAYYSNGSHTPLSTASARFKSGQKAAEDLVERLESGDIELGDDETIKIVGHSQGAAYAAGMVSFLAKHEKYSSRLEVAYYLAPHQPTDINHPTNVKGVQGSRRSDKVSSTDLLSKWDFMKYLPNGGSEFGKINGLPNSSFHTLMNIDDARGGHDVGTYLDFLVSYFGRLGIKVTVWE